MVQRFLKQKLDDLKKVHEKERRQSHRAVLEAGLTLGERPYFSGRLQEVDREDDGYDCFEVEGGW